MFSRLVMDKVKKNTGVPRPYDFFLKRGARRRKSLKAMIKYSILLIERKTELNDDADPTIGRLSRVCSAASKSLAFSISARVRAIIRA